MASIQTLEEWLNYPKDGNSGAPHPAVLINEPGNVMSYSNSGYVILQMLIEDVTNKSFNDYMKEAVLQPLAMRKSNYDVAEIIAEGLIEDLANNYDVQ